MRWVIALGVWLLVASACLADEFNLRRPLGLIEPDLPINKPLTKSLVALGEQLFFDTRLSRSGRTSCATCHRPEFGFAEPNSVSVADSGVFQRRNAPSLYNVGFLPTVMWDGRFKSLEAQSLDPFKKNGEMGLDADEVLDTIAADANYVVQFERAFGGAPTVDGLAHALSAYQRTLVSGDTPFDRYLFSGEENALTDDQKKGLEVFSSRAGCLNCHDVFHPRFNPLGGGVALFTDFRFHNLGVGYNHGRFKDPGRYGWSRDPKEWGTFRTPTLRNLTLTAPYMHDGGLKTLEDVVDFYNRGGNSNPNLSPSIRPLFLSKEEKRLLVEFLKSLTDPVAQSLADHADR